MNKKYFLVGGYVRDLVMARVHQLPVSYADRDWVVTGATPESMQAEGFVSVGADFPVFLHPRTHEEYALARTGRHSPATTKVTLKEDLFHRDLTINAMAMEGEHLIDPYGGIDDINTKTLRHVSPAFSEDPIRVLRVARFYARFEHFSVAEETLALMTRMVTDGALNDLVAERVWKETEKALSCKQPSRFFEALHLCGALAVIFPELAALQGVPQTATHHPEIDTYIHTMMVVDQAAGMSKSVAVRYAALTHDLGKALSPPDMLPRHIGHEAAGVPLVKQLCRRLRIPGQVQELAVAVTKYHLQCHRVFEMRNGKVVDLLSSIGGFRVQGRVEAFVLACQADARGRLGFESTPYPQGKFLLEVYNVTKTVKGQRFIDQGHPPGPNLQDLIRQARARLIHNIRRQYT